MRWSAAAGPLICGVVSLLMGFSAVRAEGTRPNLLLIVAEDLSPRLGAFGDTVARTPQLDALARESVRRGL